LEKISFLEGQQKSLLQTELQLLKWVIDERQGKKPADKIKRPTYECKFINLKY
jgi:hypothetical protein